MGVTSVGATVLWPAKQDQGRATRYVWRGTALSTMGMAKAVRSGLRADCVDLHAGGVVVDVVLGQQVGQPVVQPFFVISGPTTTATGWFGLRRRTTRGLRLVSRFGLDRAAAARTAGLGIRVEVGPAVDDLDVAQARLDQSLSIVVNQDRPGNAA